MDENLMRLGGTAFVVEDFQEIPWYFPAGTREIIMLPRGSQVRWG